ncbi:MAG: fimbrillin family protein [Alistipes sp.]|nr:fimbrillin family protein [Alistipes sp.]
MNGLKNNIRIVTLAVRASVVVACAWVMTSCFTKEELDSRGVIRLGVSAPAKLSSRAAINSVNDLSQYSGDKVGIFGLEIDRSTPVLGAWSGNLVMSDVKTSAVDADGKLHWNGTYYYPLEDTRYVEFFAYHPHAEIGTEGDNYVEMSGSDDAPTLFFTLDGSQDVMYTTPVVGNVSTAPGKLKFKHALTRLTFALDDSFGSFVGGKLNGITFQQVNTKGSMNIENGVLGAWSDKQDLKMVLSPVDIDAVSQVQKVEGDMMLQPGLSEFFITVHTSYGDISNVRITPKTDADGSPADVFAAAQSYRITLKFDKKQDIESSATVEDWQFGGYGVGVVE